MVAKHRANVETVSNSATKGYESELWQMADALRGSLDAAEYKHVVLGLFFLKYISDAFEEARTELEQEINVGANPEDPDEYRAKNVFWVPPDARWQRLQAGARQPSIGQLIDDAMLAIESNNSTLKGVLPKDYARPALDKTRLGQVVDLVSNVHMSGYRTQDTDVLGRIYEYFLERFALEEGRKGGQFYTPRSVVRLLVEMLDPYNGRVYDPCCGSAGMFVQSIEFIRAHAKGTSIGNRSIGDISIYGQESNYTTWRMARMNLAIRGIEGQIEHGDSFLNNRHPDLRADFILANPPFNVSDWGGEKLRDDRRWEFGVPPVGNANFAWIQHILFHLAPRGIAGFVLGNNSLTSTTGGEDAIRKGIVDRNLVDCIVSLPDRLFHSTPIPAGIWILRKGRDATSLNPVRKDEVLFIDATDLGTSISRTRRELLDDDISKIANTYREWKDGAASNVTEEGFSRTVPKDEIVASNYNMLPSAYVQRGYVPVRGGPELSSVISNSTIEETYHSLETLIKTKRVFEEALQDVVEGVSRLEQELHFTEMSLRDLLERSDNRLGLAEEPEVLTCTERGGLILQRERFAKRVASKDASKYKIVHKGDIVYNPYLLWKGAIDQCWIVELGITSPAYEILRVRPGFDPNIVGQIATSNEMIRRYDGISFGTVQRRRRAPIELFLELKVNYPTGMSIGMISNLLTSAQDCRFAARNAERVFKSFITYLCTKLQ